MTNLTERVENALPPEALAFLRRAAETAAEHGWRIYLVGGYVRDLLMERAHYDLDVAVEGDAIALARELEGHLDARLEATHSFGTAYMELGGGKHFLDLVTARREWYESPGALPTVEPGTIADDLARRDFTINAMAIPVLSEGTGDLLDPHGGLVDLGAGLVRVLHPRSFIDDPTRIPRAVKYAVRLGFTIEPGTLELIFQAVRDGALAIVSLDRIVREILYIMQERRAGVMLARLEELGVLRAIHPYLGWPYPADSPINLTEDANLPAHERLDTYLAILGAEFAPQPEEAEALARSLGLGAHHTRLMRDAAQLVHDWPRLGAEGLSPSQVYELLKKLDSSALEAYRRIEAMSADAPAWDRLNDYLDRLRHVRPELDGNYLKGLGLPPGAIYRDVLGALMNAKLDGQLPAREDEERFVAEWLAENNTGGETIR
jgi:tRNA nucleotidyltransferase (CCA-adding enzyme)